MRMHMHMHTRTCLGERPDVRRVPLLVDERGLARGLAGLHPLRVGRAVVLTQDMLLLDRTVFALYHGRQLD
jgi:hypothetical protein